MRRSVLALPLSLVLYLAFGAPAAALTGSGTWNHLGTNGLTPPGASLNGHVYEMYATADALYVGGNFSNAGGIAPADRIAKWDGKDWSSIGSAPIADNGDVYAIAVNAGKVYAGGNFLNAGGNAAADYLAVFDGVGWKPFCNGTGAAFSLQVNALQIIGPTLYVGGTFQNANGIPAADYLVACNMTTGAMTPLVDGGGDFTGPINDLAATTDGKLYAGGNFANLDGVTDADRVAWYDGSWHGLGGTDIGGIVRSLHASGTDVYVASDGLNIGGNPRADHLVKWNGTSYSSVGSDYTGTNGYFPTSAYINEMTSFGSLLFASGDWQNAKGQPEGDMLAYFDGGIWRPLGSNGAGNGALNGNTEALAIFGGQVYAGGGVTAVGGDPKAMFAASRSLVLPDAVIRTSSGNYVGTDIYNGTAAGQTKTIAIPRGTSKTFRVVIWNDGLVSTAFTLKGTTAGSGYTFKFIEDWSGTHEHHGRGEERHVPDADRGRDHRLPDAGDRDSVGVGCQHRELHHQGQLDVRHAEGRRQGHRPRDLTLRSG